MPLALGRAYGVFTGNIALLPGDYLLESAGDNVVAHAGGGQGAATQLNTQTSRIITVATAADSVMLPPSTPGLELLVINHGANSMQVFGTSPDTIDDQATATGVAQMANSLVIYTCATAGAWYTEGLATGFAKSSGLQTLTYSAITNNVTNTQASGTAIASQICIVTNSSNPGSVTLPVSAPGLSITVRNTSATNVTNVFPNAGGTTTETINALSANAAYAMTGIVGTTFNCVVAGQWYTSPVTAS
jgi:hypothetical protein